MIKQPNSYNCFICGLKNVSGVHVSFYSTVDDEGGPEVLARFTARDVHQGYPGRIHGGVAMGILDETIGRAINAHDEIEGEPSIWGVTMDFSMRFHKPAPLNVPLTARGRITRDTRRLFEGSGEIYLPDGSVAISATGKYLKMALDSISETAPTDLGWRVYADEESG